MRVNLSSMTAMTVHRRILKKDKVVYLLVGPKRIKYKRGRSRIAYIGTTKKGAKRIASSVAYRAEEILAHWGFRQMDVYIVSCTSVPGLKSWRYLERALLAEFLALYQRLPKCNRQGINLRYDGKLERLFKRKTIDQILMRFESLPRRS
ncbi:MAG: hypothetical protein HYS38_06190 [Acidobacteria bacterium]|nr:hypothetical protein [Acidobacteriota bacterium]